MNYDYNYKCSNDLSINNYVFKKKKFKNTKMIFKFIQLL